MMNDKTGGKMIRFILGTLFGGIVGVVTLCLCIAAGEADRMIENKTGGKNDE